MPIKGHINSGPASWLQANTGQVIPHMLADKLKVITLGFLLSKKLVRPSFAIENYYSPLSPFRKISKQLFSIFISNIRRRIPLIKEDVKYNVPFVSYASDPCSLVITLAGSNEELVHRYMRRYNPYVADNTLLYRCTEGTMILNDVTFVVTTVHLNSPCVLRSGDRFDRIKVYPLLLRTEYILKALSSWHRKAFFK